MHHDLVSGTFFYFIIDLVFFKNSYTFTTYKFIPHCLRGTYKMERRDGTSFDCKIPPFSLESKSDETSPNNTFLGN